jgi:hypothetical protein
MFNYGGEEGRRGGGEGKIICYTVINFFYKNNMIGKILYPIQKFIYIYI